MNTVKSIPLLQMKNITKDFSGVLALDDITLELEAGEVLSLCGENGSGKSTLMKILNGIWAHGNYQGEILLEGVEQKYNSIDDSKKQGIAMIHQELALIPQMTVFENLFLGNESSTHGVLSKHTMYQRAEQLLKTVQLDVSIDSMLGDLGAGQQQLVEIARAIGQNARILVLDEPTASLTETETEVLLSIIKKLRNEGVACVYISHKLNEVKEISDRIMVIRDGEFIGVKEAEDITEQDIIAMMVGRELTEVYPQSEHDIGQVIFEAKHFNVYDTVTQHIKRVDDVSFKVHAGEILGVSGLVGSGRTELAKAIYGAWSGIWNGEVYLDGEKMPINSPHNALEYGIALVPEERKKEGIIGIQSVANNMSLASLPHYANRFGVIDDAKAFEEIKRAFSMLKVKAASYELDCASLSGGNQQKIVLAKCILARPKLLILDEPTHGIDVGAKYEIYVLMQDLAKQGYGIIMISSELPEILGVSDRVLVMHEGKIRGDFVNDHTLTQEAIMHAALGVKHAS